VPSNRSAPKRKRGRQLAASSIQLTGGLVFALVRRAAIFVSLLGIPGRFSGHIAGIEMVRASRILAGLLLSWLFVVRHWTSHSLERVTMLNQAQVVMFQHSVSLAGLATS